MPSFTTIYAIAAGAAMLVAATMGWLYTGSLKANGRLEHALATATTRLEQINAALKEKDAIHGTNTALGDDELFDGLRAKPPSR